MNSDFEKQIDAFGDRCQRRLIGYRWNDLVANLRVMRVTDSTPVTCTVYQRQLRLHGHVARCPEADPAHRVISVTDNPE